MSDASNNLVINYCDYLILQPLSRLTNLNLVQLKIKVHREHLHSPFQSCMYW